MHGKVWQLKKVAQHIVTIEFHQWIDVKQQRVQRR